MFKYFKTIGAHCGAPEPEYIAIGSSTVMPIGSLCEVEGGALVCASSAKKSKFITTESKAVGDGKLKIKCIRVLPGMLVKVDYDGSIDNISAGSTIAPSVSDGSCTSCQEGDGGIEVVDVSEYSTKGTVTVTIHC